MKVMSSIWVIAVLKCYIYPVIRRVNNYDGPLLDQLEDSSVPYYVATMKRLRDLPVRVVHAGHDPGFGRERLVELADQYLELRA